MIPIIIIIIIIININIIIIMCCKQYYRQSTPNARNKEDHTQPTVCWAHACTCEDWWCCRIFSREASSFHHVCPHFGQNRSWWPVVILQQKADESKHWLANTVTVIGWQSGRSAGTGLIRRWDHPQDSWWWWTLSSCIAQSLHATVACLVHSLSKVVSFEAYCQWVLLSVQIIRHYPMT